MSRSGTLTLVGCVAAVAVFALWWKWPRKTEVSRESERAVSEVPLSAQPPPQPSRAEVPHPIATVPVAAAQEVAPPPVLPLGITTANMANLTTPDTSKEVDAAITGLLAGDVDPGEVLVYLSRVLSKAKLIEESPSFRDVKGPGVRRWVVYKSENAEDCRGVIERFVDPTGERESVSFSGPFATHRLVNAPDDLHEAFISVRIERPLEGKGFIHGSLEVNLMPDAANSNKFIPRMSSLKQYAGSGLSGKPLAFINDNVHGWKYLMNAYPRLGADGAFEAQDIDWDLARPMMAAAGDGSLKVADEIRGLLKGH